MADAYLGPDGEAPLYRDADWLRTHYVDRGLSLREVAQKAGTDKDTIRRWLVRNDIDRRPPTGFPQGGETGRLGGPREGSQVGCTACGRTFMGYSDLIGHVRDTHGVTTPSELGDHIDLDPGCETVESTPRDRDRDAEPEAATAGGGD